MGSPRLYILSEWAALTFKLHVQHSIPSRHWNLMQDQRATTHPRKCSHLPKASCSRKENIQKKELWSLIRQRSSLMRVDISYGISGSSSERRQNDEDVSGLDFWREDLRWRFGWLEFIRKILATWSAGWYEQLYYCQGIFAKDRNLICLTCNSLNFNLTTVMRRLVFVVALQGRVVNEGDGFSKCCKIIENFNIETLTQRLEHKNFSAVHIYLLKDIRKYTKIQVFIVQYFPMFQQ